MYLVHLLVSPLVLLASFSSDVFLNKLIYFLASVPRESSAIVLVASQPPRQLTEVRQLTLLPLVQVYRKHLESLG